MCVISGFNASESGGYDLSSSLVQHALLSFHLQIPLFKSNLGWLRLSPAKNITEVMDHPQTMVYIVHAAARTTPLGIIYSLLTHMWESADAKKPNTNKDSKQTKKKPMQSKPFINPFSPFYVMPESRPSS
jgi:hypothetical protein